MGADALRAPLRLVTRLRCPRSPAGCVAARARPLGMDADGGALIDLNFQRRSFETSLLLFAVAALWLSAAWAITNPGGVVIGYWARRLPPDLGWFDAIARIMLLWSVVT